jgi:hypothetical protein
MDLQFIGEADVSTEAVVQLLTALQAPFSCDDDGDVRVVTPKQNIVYLKVLTNSLMIAYRSGLPISDSLDPMKRTLLAEQLNKDYVFATFYIGGHGELQVKHDLLYRGGIMNMQILYNLLQLDAILVNVQKELPDVTQKNVERTAK